MGAWVETGPILHRRYLPAFKSHSGQPRLAVGFRVVHVDRRPVTLNLFVLGSATEGHKMDSLLKAHPSSGTTEQKNLTPIRSLPVIFNDGLVGLRR